VRAVTGGLVLVGSLTLTGWAGAPGAGAVDRTFSYTGATVNVTVPPGVCALELAAGNGRAAGDVSDAAAASSM